RGWTSRGAWRARRSEAQCRRRRDRDRTSGRRIGRADCLASAECPRTHRRQARDRRNLHRRRARRRDAGRAVVAIMRNWVITRADDGIATLLFDRAGATTNTLSREALAELNEALDVFDRDPPKGVIIRSAKASGFIAGADITEFGELS